MPRYINEDEFCEYIRKSTTPSGAEWTVSKIKDMPAADVVEVVRCKDCKYCEKAEEKYEGYRFEPTDIVCTVNNVYTYSNRFCSYGERKDAE